VSQSIGRTRIAPNGVECDPGTLDAASFVALSPRPRESNRRNHASRRITNPFSTASVKLRRTHIAQFLVRNSLASCASRVQRNLLFQEFQDFIKELLTVLFEQNKMRSILDQDVPLCRRVNERAHKTFAVFLEGPRIKISTITSVGAYMLAAFHSGRPVAW